MNPCDESVYEAARERLSCRILVGKRREEPGKLAKNLGQHQMVVVVT
jgi:hypothetical protein